MKKEVVKVGGLFKAKVNGRIVTVRVDAIRKAKAYRAGKVSNTEVYDVTNLTTGRTTTFKSAAKFRSVAAINDPARKKLTREQLGIPMPSSNKLVEYCTDEEPDCCEGEAGAICPGCGKMVKEAEQRPDPIQGKKLSGGTTSLPPAPSAQSPSGRMSPLGTSEPTNRPSSPAGVGAGLAERYSRPVDNAPHLMIIARAGTGKTTTLIEGLNYWKGLPVRITPSPQQKAIWDQLVLSPKESSVCFVAFNKSIADELKSRVPPGVSAMTMHSMGAQAVKNFFGYQKPENDATIRIVAEVMGYANKFQALRAEPVVTTATADLVSLCKQNLVGASNIRTEDGREWCDEEWWSHNLEPLCRRHDIELNGSREKVFSLVPKVLERCKTPKGFIAFDDQIWLPVVLNLPLPRYGVLLVDEFQDTNRCQQALARRAGDRLILCGDPRQAIYGFAGADAESMKRMETELQSSRTTCPHCESKNAKAKDGSFIDCVFCGGVGLTDRGLVTLPLTVTRRCGRKIVNEARQIVPDFEAHETNSDGLVTRAFFESEIGAPTYHTLVADEDFILCRCNAPLVSECFRFIRKGRKANIVGRDVGRNLSNLVRKITKDAVMTVVEFIKTVETWRTLETAKENAKNSPSDDKLQRIEDQSECLLALASDTEDVSGIHTKIKNVFGAMECPKCKQTGDDGECYKCQVKLVRKPGIRLSSIHKAKGLESKRVFYITGDGKKTFGPPLFKLQPWEREQEENLRYVAITRAIEELVYVG